MARENPRTYRLSAEALEALEWLEEKTGQKRAQIIEAAILKVAAEARQEVGILERLDRIEQALARLDNPPGIILCAAQEGGAE